MLDWIGLGEVSRLSVQLVKEQKKGRESKKERGGKSGKWVLCCTWTPHQHLTVLLTLFDHFNNLNHDRANLSYESKLQRFL